MTYKGHSVILYRVANIRFHTQLFFCSGVEVYLPAVLISAAAAGRKD